MSETLNHFYASHKGKLTDKWSSYLSVYERTLRQYRDRQVRLLEIGVQNGGSLEVWSQYFSKAVKIVGCDVNPDCAQLVFEDPRIAVVVGDANSEAVQKQLLRYASAYDVVIDDGSHRSGDIITSFTNYFPYVADGGIYIVEDLHCSYWKEFDGGLFDPYSSVSFFKHLADVINGDHWGIKKPRSHVLRGFENRYSLKANDDALQHVHSIEFTNSMCIVHKESSSRNGLGSRTVVGDVAVVAAADVLIASLTGAPPQDRNEWTNRESDPEEELSRRLGEIKHLTQVLAECHQKLAEHGKSIAEHCKSIADLRQELNTYRKLDELASHRPFAVAQAPIAPCSSPDPRFPWPTR